ncbi:zinc finger, CCHC-type containing protein [Tanacetum coccineum]
MYNNLSQLPLPREITKPSRISTWFMQLPLKFGSIFRQCRSVVESEQQMFDVKSQHLHSPYAADRAFLEWSPQLWVCGPRASPCLASVVIESKFKCDNLRCHNQDLVFEALDKRQMGEDNIISSRDKVYKFEPFDPLIDELRAVSYYMLGASRVQILENNLKNLKLTREEDGEFKTVDPQCLLGSEMLEGLDPKILGSLLKSIDFATLVFLWFLALEWHLEEIHVTWAHLEKKRTRLRTYTKSMKKYCSQSVETASHLVVLLASFQLAIGLNAFLQDITHLGGILLLVSHLAFLAQFFPPGRTAKLRNDILMFQQHHGESLSKAWTRFKDLLQKFPYHGINLWLQVQIFYDHVNHVTRRTIDQSAGGKLRDRNTEESWALLEDLALYDNESSNDPRDFAKPVKAIALPQDVPSTSDCRLIELGIKSNA